MRLNFFTGEIIREPGEDRRNEAWRAKLAAASVERFYVYAISDGRGNYKVGQSKNLEARLAELQIGCPDTLSIFDVVQFDSLRSSRGFERDVHRQLADFRLRGEWFSVGDPDVIREAFL